MAVTKDIAERKDYSSGVVCEVVDRGADATRRLQGTCVFAAPELTNVGAKRPEPYVCTYIHKVSDRP
jgi:hypothetical protein